MKSIKKKRLLTGKVIKTATGSPVLGNEQFTVSYRARGVLWTATSNYYTLAFKKVFMWLKSPLNHSLPWTVCTKKDGINKHVSKCEYFRRASDPEYPALQYMHLAWKQSNNSANNFWSELISTFVLTNISFD